MGGYCVDIVKEGEKNRRKRSMTLTKSIETYYRYESENYKFDLHVSINTKSYAFSNIFSYLFNHNVSILTHSH